MTINPKPKIHYAKTSDGWKIALHRYQGKKYKHPVLLVHGFASNRFNLDFPYKDLSLARYLRKKGFDAWVIDLRGCGLSKRPGKLPSFRWHFDDFVFKDIPAAVDAIVKMTGTKQIHWVGHSMGGILAYPFSGIYRKKHILRSLVTVASPLTTHKAPGYFKQLYKLDPLFRLIPWLPFKSFSKFSSIFAGLMLGAYDPMLYSKDNMNREILSKLFQKAAESVPASLVLQIHDFFRHKYFGSRNGKVDFFEHLEELRMPLLMIIGSIDNFTTKADVRLAFRRLKNAKKQLMIFGKDHGQINEYGHIDLILGKNAPTEVFPHIYKWIKDHD